MFEGFNAFIQNPAMYLMKSKFNIPNNITAPQDMINYLLQTGQLSQNQYNQVYSRFKDLANAGQLPQQPNN